MVKVTLVGAGSSVFARQVITDILDSDTYTREWRTTVAAAVLAARAAAG